MATILADDYVDVDAIVEKYHSRRSTVMFLFAAIGFILFGTLSGYTALQYSNSKLDSAQVTVVEFATTTLNSEQCQTTPSDPICQKAKRVVENPDVAIRGGSFITTPSIPIHVAAHAYNFQTDPLANIIAAVLTQPVILRIQ